MSGIVGSLFNHRGSGIVAKLGTDGHTFNSGGAGKKAVTEAVVVVADGVDGSKLADDAVDSEHYTDGSIDNAHIADDAIDSEHYADGSIDNAHIADDAIDSEHYAAGSIDTAHIADDQITLGKMAAGTDGNIISYDASGDPVAIATGSDGQVLTSTGAGSPPAFEDSSGFDVSSITGATAIGATPADTDEFVLSDGGVLKRMDYSYIKKSGRTHIEYSATNSASLLATTGAFTSTPIPYVHWVCYSYMMSSGGAPDLQMRLLEGTTELTACNYHSIGTQFKGNGSDTATETFDHADDNLATLCTLIKGGSAIGQKIMIRLCFEDPLRNQGGANSNIAWFCNYRFLGNSDYQVVGHSAGQYSGTPTVDGFQLMFSGGDMNYLASNTYASTYYNQ